MRILGISGSLRRDSFNTQLLREAGALAPTRAQLELYGGLEQLPPYDADRDGESPPVSARRFRRAVAAADCLLIATPEYNGSIPGPLKNAVDWGSRPFPESPLRNKPVAVVGASSGRFGAVWAQADLRRVLGIAGARVLDQELAVPRADAAFEDERLRDPEARGRLAEILELLVEEAHRSQAGRNENPAARRAA